MNIKLTGNSPYAYGQVLVFSKDEEALLTRKKFSYSQNLPGKYYMIGDEDTLWGISYRVYGSSRWWHILYDVNNIEDPFELTPGTTLFLPDLNVARIYLES